MTTPTRWQIPAPAAVSISRLARAVLTAFLFTFCASRVLVFLIMTRRLPDLYAHVGGTHVHHLNYGIFLLTAVCAYLLLARPSDRARRAAGATYGVGLALTFDEFGMWLYLDDRYWQRASFDAILVITALLALAVVTPPWRDLRPRHWVTAVAIAAMLAAFGVLLQDTLRYADVRLGPYFQDLQSRGPN